MSAQARTPEGLHNELAERVDRLTGAMEDGFRGEVMHWAERIRVTLRQIEIYFEQEGR